MESNVSMVILVIVIVLIIIILPVYNVFTRQDDMSYNLALKATTNFADKVRTTGELTYQDYQDFLAELDVTNNTYEVEIEGYQYYIVNQNDGTYKQEYIIDYTEDIVAILENEKNGKKHCDGVYTLDKGERFYVRIKNTNITKADTFLSNIKILEDKSKIDIDYGGVILVNTTKK